MKTKPTAATLYIAAAQRRLVHAAGQAHDVENFGGDLLDRVVGAVEIADLMGPEQRFHFSHFQPALAH